MARLPRQAPISLPTCPDPRLRWSLFCRVLDNFGDAAVTWRLARQLRHEWGAEVRLYLDHVPTLAALVPQCKAGAAVQQLEGVQVVRWDRHTRFAQDAQVVLETFGCDVPPDYIQAMASARPPGPVWINLEYLSAEPWVEQCHGLPSPHPRHALTRYFFFPGFGPQTGGLLRETSLLAHRYQFQNDPKARDDFWHTLHCPAPAPDSYVISLFGYDTIAIYDLLQAWHDSPTPIRCLIPASGGLAQRALTFLKQRAPQKSGRETQNTWSVHTPPSGLQQWGALEWVHVPFRAQQDYDSLLWVSHFNLVRGEDSFVRAQWAGRPLLWHIYPQSDAAHWIKLDAFLERYLAGLPARAAPAGPPLSVPGTGRGDTASAWRQLAPHGAELQAHARAWANTTSVAPDLTRQLVQFAKSLL